MARAKPERLTDYLDHIVEACLRIQRYTTGLSVAAFEQDTMVQDAVIRNFENIGEAGHQLSQHNPDWLMARPELKAQLRLAYTMRNRLAHGYFEIDLDTVWRAATEDAPKLARFVEDILASLPR
jgi:uncharacterized protein with HEPN domain